MKTIVLLALTGVIAKPLIHPETGLAITTTGKHWYGQEPLALAQKPLIHPETGLAITTTGKHWYGQEPLALIQTQSDSDSSSSDSDEDVQVGDKDDTSYPHWMDGFGGYHTYVRDVPDRFETESDDKLMESMYKNYAHEGMTNHLPNGHFWVDRENARRAATEVVGTHLNLVGAAAKSYLDENFPAIWARFDVNEENKVEIDRMPQLLRMVCGNNEACIGL